MCIAVLRVIHLESECTSHSIEHLGPQLVAFASLGLCYMIAWGIPRETCELEEEIARKPKGRRENPGVKIRTLDFSCECNYMIHT
jgi:hypothetical protein